MTTTHTRQQQDTHTVTADRVIIYWTESRWSHPTNSSTFEAIDILLWSRSHFLISLHTIRLFFPPATSHSRPLQAVWGTASLSVSHPEAPSAAYTVYNWHHRMNSTWSSVYTPFKPVKKTFIVCVCVCRISLIHMMARLAKDRASAVTLCVTFYSI